MAEPSKRKRPGPRRALTEGVILDATLQLLDEGGATGVSVRGIAARVSVAPNAVYTYFPDKAAVIGGSGRAPVQRDRPRRLRRPGRGRGASAWNPSPSNCEPGRPPIPAR